MSPPPVVPCAWATVALRYCQLTAASSMAADRYMGDRWTLLDCSAGCRGADFSAITPRMCSVLARDGSVVETFCSNCWRRGGGGRQMTDE